MKQNQSSETFKLRHTKVGGLVNSYALKGHKIKVTADTAKNGDSLSKDAVKTHLELDKTYTVEETTVNRSYTSVLLKEVKGVTFSSVSFVDINNQSKADDMKHPDWETWETDEGYQRYLEEN